MRLTTVTLTLAPYGLPQTLPGRLQGALLAVSEQALADCNRYARDDTGRLIASSKTASDPANGRLIWRTPYARRVYYTGTPRRGKNPGASLRWCEKAKALHAESWRALLTQTLGGD